MERKRRKKLMACFVIAAMLFSGMPTMSFAATGGEEPVSNTESVVQDQTDQPGGPDVQTDDTDKQGDDAGQNDQQDDPIIQEDGSESEDEGTLDKDDASGQPSDGTADSSVLKKRDALLLNTRAADKSGSVKVTLYYEDKRTSAAENTDGMFYYTDRDYHMPGYLKLSSDGLTEDVENLRIRLKVPKKYVYIYGSPGFILPEFSSVSPHEISHWERDDTYYYYDISFAKYDKTEELMIPFEVSFAAGVVPEDYSLYVEADAYVNDEIVDSADKLRLRPKYDEYKLVKYLNNNVQDKNSKDGVEVAFEADSSEDPFADENVYATFMYMVNDIKTGAKRVTTKRAPERIVLTDVLPTYADNSGNTRTAQFVQAANPDWVDNGDGTVSITLDGINPSDAEAETYKVKLKLRFPDMKYEQMTENKFEAQATNKVHLDATPYGMSSGESHIYAEDDLLFKIVKGAYSEGQFAKGVDREKVLDTTTQKSNQVRWKLMMTNPDTITIKHLVIQDRKIGDDLAGLDPRLKFIRLEPDMKGTRLAEGQTYESIIDHVKAYFSDGTTENYSVATQDDGSFSITFNESKICTGYDIVFKDDYEMGNNETVSFYPYTKMIDPEAVHYDDEISSNNYFQNQARAMHWYEKSGSRKYVFLTSAATYRLVKATESLSISKKTYYNSVGYNSLPGTDHFYYLGMSGELLDAEDKDYGNLQVIDLLPEGINYRQVLSTSFKKGEYKEQVIENYHNSGRTAVVFTIDADTFRTCWADNGNTYLSIGVKIAEDAVPGTVMNNVYFVGENMASDYAKGTEVVEDTYDLNNNGSNTDLIASAKSQSVITRGDDIYAHKYIFNPANNSWIGSGMTIRPGDDVRYKLMVKSNQEEDISGLVVADIIPVIGDNDTRGRKRNSEFATQLKSDIEVPEGYTVFYTTSDAVYSMTMEEMVGSESLAWSSHLSDPSKVTAFKIVADNGTLLKGHEEFDAIVPCTTTAALSEESEEILNNKDVDESGRLYLQANNSFGYYTDDMLASGNEQYSKISNVVYTRIMVGQFSVVKVDKDTEETLKGAVFKLTGKVGQETIKRELTTDENGKAFFKNLTAGEYTLTEEKSPENYSQCSNTWKVTITQSPITFEYSAEIEENVAEGNEAMLVGAEQNVFTIANKSSTEVPVTKSWSGYDGSDEFTATVTLTAKAGGNDYTLPDGIETTHTFTSPAEGKYTFENLPAKTPAGADITYSVSETGLASADATVSSKNGTYYIYSKEETPHIENGPKYKLLGKWVPTVTEEDGSISIVNTWTPATDEEEGTTGFKIRKVDDHGNLITAKQATFKVEKKTDNGTETVGEYKTIDGVATIADLTEGEYTVTESAAPSGFLANSGSFKLNVTKELKLKEVKETDLINLFKRFFTFAAGASGTPYSWDGENLELTVKNREATEATVEKVWHDGEDAANKRPAELTFDLYQQSGNGRKTAVKDADDKAVTVTLPVNDAWEATVNDLPKYDAQGNEIEYTWEENGLTADYDLTDTAAEGTVTTFTNTLKTQVTVNKVWEGQDNDSLIPGSISVKLLANGEEKDTAELTKRNRWSHTFGATADDVLYAYDEQGAKITYTVEEADVDGYDGDISDPVTDADGNVTFTATNTYSAEGTLALGGLKKLDVETGKIVAGQFTFTLKDGDEVLATGTNDADGNIIFDPAEITFRYNEAENEDDRGDHNLVISEEKKEGRENGAATDAEDVEVKVNVKDNGNGTLTVTPDDITSSVTMVNSYEATGSITFSGKKSIDHERRIEEGEVFTFTVKEGEETVATGESDADGNITFTKIDYVLNKDKDDTGTHTYTVTEEAYDSKGVTNSEESYTVTVKVEDNGDGTLKITPSENHSGLDFVNPYEAKGEIALSLTKELEHREFKAGDEWTFTIEAEEGAPMPVDEEGNEVSTVTLNPEEGNEAEIALGTFKYDLEDIGNKAYESKTFTYTITESGEIEGVKNDEDTDRELKIKVTDDGSGELKVEAAEDSEEVRFVNTYETSGEITFSGKKTLKGKELKAGQFSFELYDANGALLETVTNDADGNYSFSTIDFTGEDLDTDENGNYIDTAKEYRVVEQEGNDPRITYDDTEYNITATLADDGNGSITVTADPEEDSYDFTNVYKKPGVDTGDHNNIMGWIALLLISIAGLSVTVFYRRRRKVNE